MSIEEETTSNETQKDNMKKQNFTTRSSLNIIKNKKMVVYMIYLHLNYSQWIF